MLLKLRFSADSIPSALTTLINDLPTTRPARKHTTEVLKRRALARTGPKRTAHLRHTSFRSTGGPVLRSRLTDNQSGRSDMLRILKTVDVRRDHLALKLREILWRRHKQQHERAELGSHRVPLDLNALIRRVTFAIERERHDTSGGKPVAAFRFLGEDWSPLDRTSTHARALAGVLT